MKKSIFGKTLVVGIIILFTGTTVALSIGENIFMNRSDDFTKTTYMIQSNVVVSSEDDSVTVTVQSIDDVTSIYYQISGFISEKVVINDNEYVRIFLDKESNIMEKGRPDIPNICRSIIIPDDTQMNAHVVDAVYQEYTRVLIAPSKGVLSRVVDPDDIPYEFDDVYYIDDWYPGAIAELGDPYILRDFRGQVITLNPFQYNPVTETLRVYSDITIEVFPVGSGKVNVYDRDEPPHALDTDFKSVYEHHFLNFNSDRYSPVEERGNMLVITYDGFWSAMVPFVQWKNMKGVPTEMVTVSSIGNDANNIKNYIENYYNVNGLTFVLLVGDVAQVTTIENYYGYPLYEWGASDPSYSYIVGNDHYPDLFIGRFSAQAIAQVETQVERTIEYEKYPQSGADWYHKGTGIASNQGPGDDGEFDDEHMDNMRDDLLAYTYTEVDRIYDPWATDTQVSNALNNGRSIINYCGHGSPTSWSSSGFNTGDVNALTNDNMLPFICSVACNNGAFDDYTTCFAEAWLRATHNGEPTGAIAVFASSVGQYWSPPMDAQDEMVDILVESYRYNKKHTFGGLSFNGCMHMNDQYGSYGFDMTDTWHVFGDPSLQVRTDTPSSMTVAHNTTIDVGSSSFEVIVPGVKNVLCTISRDYNLLGYGYTDASGHATIQFEAPITDEGNLDLVVTAYNKIPYITSITVNTGPVFIRGDTNEDGMVDVGDVVYLIHYLYRAGPEPVPVIDAGDVNDDEIVDIADVVYLINYLYRDGPQPPAPFPGSGFDPTP